MTNVSVVKVNTVNLAMDTHAVVLRRSVMV